MIVYYKTERHQYGSKLKAKETLTKAFLHSAQDESYSRQNRSSIA